MSSNYESATALPGEPAAANEILISLADGVVVDLRPTGEGAHARKLLARTELAGGDQEHDLFGKLLAQRNVAVLTERYVH